MSKPMKTLTLGDVLYEIVDEAARKRVTALEYETTNMSTSINNDIKQSIETINTNISDLNKKIGDVGEYTDLTTKIDDVNNTLDNKINEVDTNLNNKINEKSEELESKINTKITNPETGSVGQILVVDSVDENGKPISYKTIENVKSTYEYAKLGGYTGTEEEFYQKLAQDNTSDVEYNELKSNLGGFKFYNNPEVICEVTRTIYSDDTNEYILANSEEGIALLEDKLTYTTAHVILLVADNSIYYNSEGISPSPETEEGSILLDDVNTYYSAEIILENKYGDFYKDDNNNYILADSEIGNSLLLTDYASLPVEGNYYRIAGADSVIPFSDGGEYSYSGIYYYYTNSHVTDKECLVVVSSLESSSEGALNRCDIEVVNGEYTRLASADRSCSDYKTSSNMPVYGACKIWHCIPTGKEMKINLTMNSMLYMIILEKS